MNAIVFRAHDSLVLYLNNEGGNTAYLFDIDIDTEDLVRSFNLTNFEEYDIESLPQLLDDGDVIESKYNLYIRTDNGINVYHKQDLILPLIDVTLKMISETTTTCGYRPLTSRQSQQLKNIIVDEYTTMRQLPINTSFPILATYDYVNAQDSIEDRLNASIIKTNVEAWREAAQTVYGCINDIYQQANGDIKHTAKFVFSYCAKLILGVC